ncbi:MAG: ArnT family glycosyltransferase [Christensenellales bacterium]|jgi:hypothetical protein
MKKSKLPSFLLSPVLWIGAFSAFTAVSWVQRLPGLPILAGGLGALITLGAIWGIQRKLTTERICFLIGCGAFLLHTAYILYTNHLTRQHDVNFLGRGDGHTGYMEAILQNGMRLPDEDPRNRWQFYHPPLHHWLSALWVKFQIRLGVEYEQAFEGVQSLTLYWSGLSIVIFYKLLRELNFRDEALWIPFGVFSFHPAYVLLSGSINNDMLCMTLMLLSIWLAIRWFRQPRYDRILLLSAAIGFSMLAKTSGVLTAPAIAFLFLWKLWEQRKKPLRLIAQYAAFVVLCLPVGLSWSLYCLIRYGIPLGYVAAIDPGSIQDISWVPLYGRLLLADPSHWQSFFFCWNYPTEYCIPLAILKTSVFDEYALAEQGTTGYILAAVLFHINALWAAGSMVLGGLTAFRHRKSPYTWFFILFWATVLGAFIFFCFDHPQTCTMSIRYFVPCIWAGLIGTAVFLRDCKRVWRATLALSAGLFAIFSLLVYMKL